MTLVQEYTKARWTESEYPLTDFVYEYENLTAGCVTQSYYPLKCIIYTGKMSRMILGKNQGHCVVLELV